MLTEFLAESRNDSSLAQVELPAAVNRTIISHTNQFLAESLSVRGGSAPIKGHTAEFQLVLPYGGMFEWDVGRGGEIMDANHAMLVAGGLDYIERQPADRMRHSALIITPDEQIRDEIFAWSARDDLDPPTDVALPVSARLRLLVQEWLRELRNSTGDNLALEELGISSLREAFRLKPSPAQGCSRVVRLAKQLVHEHLFEPLSLQMLADAIDVTPVYLTQCFSRSEGKPLYRYVLHLRLAEAMNELPECDDITALALDLGFSSHSHFSTAFKAFAGMSPSAFREAYRGKNPVRRCGHA